MGFLSGVLGGGGGGSSSTTTTAQFLPSQKHAFDKFFPQVEGLLEKGTFQSPTLLGFNPQEQEAQGKLLSLAGGRFPGVAAQGAEALAPALSGAGNPFLQQRVDEAIQPIVQQLTESILPGITQGFQLAGHRGGASGGVEGKGAGTRGDAFQQLALRNFGDQASETAGQIAFQDFTGAQGRQVAAAQLLPQLLALETAGPQLQGQVGSQQRQLSQGQQDIQDQEQFLEPQFLQMIAGLLGNPLEMSRTQTSSGGSGGGLGGLLKSGLGIASTIAGLPGIGSVFGPVGPSIDLSSAFTGGGFGDLDIFR